MIDRIDALSLASLRSGYDKYSRLKLPALTQLKPIEAAEIAEALPEPSDQTVALRWVMRGLSVEHAVAKVTIDREMVKGIRDRNREKKDSRESLGMTTEEIEEMKMFTERK